MLDQDNYATNLCKGNQGDKLDYKWMKIDINASRNVM